VLANVIVKTRVTYLVDVPHYPIMTEGDDFERLLWTVQYEIIQQDMLGGQLEDEDKCSRKT
jgi:hypothetical protein